MKSFFSFAHDRPLCPALALRTRDMKSHNSSFFDVKQ